ncbi:SSB domain-containing protein [Cephalotus follicularis]|uniref:SSB domain-containing protein n=1 Tax=Cephalotus follicularis TaxID=3775 RepID=A0A1Q3CBW5_CEPFO|nr:SSB domain-containing protein [Cephalotus follicularis]
MKSINPSLIKKLTSYSLQNFAAFSSSATSHPRFSNFFCDNIGASSGSQVYKKALKSQPPTKISWQNHLENSVSFIGSVARPLRITNTKNGSFGVYTLLRVNNAADSNSFSIRVQMWGRLGKMCMKHLKPNDFIYVSGRLASYAIADDDGKLRYYYNVKAKEVNYVAQHLRGPAYQKSQESNSGKIFVAVVVVVMITDYLSPICLVSKSLLELVQKYLYSVAAKSQILNIGLEQGEAGMERYEDNLYLWQVFFTNPYEWWDNRNRKVNSRQPDFRHKDTGEALWLNPNDPPWIKRQLQLLDSRMAEHGEGENVCSHARVSMWVYDE